MNRYLFIIAVATLAVFTACSNDDEQRSSADAVQRPIMLGTTVGDDTRAVSVSNLLNGDTVYVWTDLINSATQQVSEYFNAWQLRANGVGSLSPLPSGVTKLFPATNHLDFYALCGNFGRVSEGTRAGEPFIEREVMSLPTTSGIRHTVLSDQRTPEAFFKSDLLYSVVKDQEPVSSAVVLPFKHLLANVQVVLVAGNGITASDLSTATVKLVNLKRQVVFTPNKSADFSSQTALASMLSIPMNAQQSDIQMASYAVGSYSDGLTALNTVFCDAIVVPQTIAKGANFIQVSYMGHNTYYRIPNGSGDADFQIESGKQYRFRLIADRIGGTYELTPVSVEEWGTNTDRSLWLDNMTNSVSVNGHAYVDLGNPSCYYATMNVGASSEGDWGSYFAWGETTTKSSYTESNYTASGISTDLSISQDAARAQWGGAWRMPTQAELQWLIDNCTWTWTTSGGNDGYRITSNISGYTSNSIFLPAAGGYGSSVRNRGTNGLYWSSTYYDSSKSWYLYFISSDKYMYNSDRYYGRSVRAVLSVAASPSLSNPDGVVSFTSSQGVNSQISRTITCTNCSVSGVSVTSGSGFSVSYSGNTVTVTRTSASAISGSITVTGTAINNNYTNPSSITISVSGVAIPPSSSDTNGHAYVDLGNPRCYYATMNVGASSEGDWGSYFAWGETTTKSSFTSSNYTGPNSEIYLSISHDAARAQWGGAWRMPTDEELKWLINNCTWTWTTSGGNNGYRVTSNISGYTSNSIFLPAAGYYNGSSVNNRGQGGNYWALRRSDGDYAWNLYYWFPTEKEVNGYGACFSGESVRAVLSK